MSGSELVCLKGGVYLPADVIRGALSLESRGVILEADGDGLTARPGRMLTEADRTFLRQHKTALLSLIDYVERTVPV